MPPVHPHRLRGLFRRRYITIPVLLIGCIMISCGFWLLPMFNIHDLFYSKRQKVWRAEGVDKKHMISRDKPDTQLYSVFKEINRTTSKLSEPDASRKVTKYVSVHATAGKEDTVGWKLQSNIIPATKSISRFKASFEKFPQLQRAVVDSFVKSLNDAAKTTVKFEGAVPNATAKFLRALHASFTTAPAERAELCVIRQGRLGNRMFQFAAMLAVAREKKMTPFVETANELLQMFQLNNITIKHPGVCESFPSLDDKRTCAYDKVSFNPSHYRALALKGYFQSWRYFSGITDEIRQQFVFKPLLKASARNAFRKAVYLRQNSTTVTEDTVVVGIHIRRGDYLRWDRVEFGNIVATREYLYHATDYFRGLYKKVLFVASSDDIAWTKSTLTGADTVYLEGNSPEVDFATLCLCNHTIMTVGTFGWWSAWLVNGTTIYYRHQYAEHSNLASVSNMTDYIPSGWIPMS